MANNASASGQSSPPNDTNRSAVDVLRQVHDRGADLYNDGEPAAAFRLYQGSLLAVRPFLAHLPAVQKIIDEGLAEVKNYEPGTTPTEQLQRVKRQAFRLHELIEQVRGELKRAVEPAANPMSPPKKE